MEFPTCSYETRIAKVKANAFFRPLAMARVEEEAKHEMMEGLTEVEESD